MAKITGITQRERERGWGRGGEGMSNDVKPSALFL